MAVTITEYARPKSLKEALALLAESHPHSVVVGGGIAVSLSGAPRQVRGVDLAHAGLGGIEAQNDVVRIGSMATLNEVARAPKLSAAFGGMLPEALRTAGTYPLRNLITVGGNIVQCYYWSTLPPLLLALDATIDLARADGTRTVTASQFFDVHPVKFLEPGEIVTGVNIPLDRVGKKGMKYGGSFQRCARTANDYALVHACVAMGRAGKHMEYCRVVFGALGSLPERCPAAEEHLMANPVDEKVAGEAVQLALEKATIRRETRASNEYRRIVAAEYLKRAILGAMERL